MKISIIIPVYNCEKYLHTSVDSILQQTYKEWELILVDDGSKDNSGLICDLYAEKDNRIKKIHISNSGPSNARNIGLRNITGDYCIFVDSDDFLEITALEVLSKVVSKQHFHIVFYGYFNDCLVENKYLNKKINKCGRKIFNNNMDFKNEYTYFDNCSFTHPVWNKMYDVNFIEKNDIMFPYGINVSEDFIFNVQAYQNVTNICVIDDVLYHYIDHGTGSITTIFDAKKIESIEFIYLYSYKVIEKWNPSYLNTINNDFIRDTSVYINSLFNKDCNLEYKVKYNIVKELIKREVLIKCISEIKPMGYRNRIISVLIKYQQIKLLLLTGKISRMQFKR